MIEEYVFPEISDQSLNIQEIIEQLKNRTIKWNYINHLIDEQKLSKNDFSEIHSATISKDFNKNINDDSILKSLEYRFKYLKKEL